MNLDAFYMRFENKFRGSRDLIKKRLRIYQPVINYLKLLRSEQQALDVGCGRGEWLELLGESGVSAYGIDLNVQMISYCEELRLRVIEAEVIDHMESLESESLDMVTGFHLVEHLEFEDVIKIFSQAMRVLRPGGLIIFETPNPENLSVGACSFYIDPTHRNPLPPSVLMFLGEDVGYSQVRIVRLQQENHDLRELNSGFGTQIDAMFFGAQDYAVIACKPKESMSSAFGLAINQLRAVAQRQSIQSSEAPPPSLLIQALANARQELGFMQAQVSNSEQRAIYAEGELIQFRKRLKTLRSEFTELESVITDIYRSLSWTLTFPLRRANFFLTKSMSMVRTGISSLMCLPRFVARWLLGQLQVRPEQKAKVARLLRKIPSLESRVREFSRWNKLNSDSRSSDSRPMVDPIVENRFRRQLDLELIRRRQIG